MHRLCHGGGQQRKTLSDNVLHSDWPVSAGFMELKDPKNRVAFASACMGFLVSALLSNQPLKVWSNGFVACAQFGLAPLFRQAVGHCQRDPGFIHKPLDRIIQDRYGFLTC